MAIEDQAPFAPSSAVIRVLEAFRDTGLGNRPITEEVLVKLSIGESIVSRVIQTLRILDLITEDGKATDDLLAFKQAASDAYRGVLAEILYSAYEPVFAITGRNLEARSASQIEDAFRTYRPESLRKRMVTLFTGLCLYAGILQNAPAAPKGSTGAARPSSTSQKPPRNGTPTGKGRRGSGAGRIDPLPAPQAFTITDEDIAVLSEEEFTTVWAALGTVARARARAKALPAQDDAGVG